MKNTLLKKIAVSSMIAATLLLAGITSANAGTRVRIYSSFGFWAPPAYGNTIVLRSGRGHHHRHWRRHMRRQTRRMVRHCFRHPNRC